jgi:hypothetical protein
MVRPRIFMKAFTPLAVAALLVGAARPAVAEPVLFGTAEVTAGAGHDTNMFLPVATAATMRPPLIGGWFGRAAPRVGGALTAGNWRLETSYALDYRGSEAAGRLVEQRVEAGLTLPRLGPLQPGLAASVGRFDASQYSDDRFLFASGELSLRWEITAAFRASGSYRAELRHYPNRLPGTDSDVVHLADLRLAYHPSIPCCRCCADGLGAGGWYVALDPVRVSLIDTGDLRFIRAGPDVEIVIRRVSIGVWGWAGSLERGGFSRLWQVGAGLGCLVRLTPNLDALATVDFTGSPSTGDPVAPDYARRYAALSLVAHVTGRASFAPRADRADEKPAIGAGRVRFRLRAAHAAAVEVIGSWDDWQTPGRAMASTSEAGLWEASLDLPPGQHRYRFVVDGKPVRPPQAPRYVPDDFGGEDAVIDIAVRQLP